MTVTIDVILSEWLVTASSPPTSGYASECKVPDCPVCHSERPSRQVGRSRSITINPAAKQAWCAELRSGNWMQVRGEWGTGARMKDGRREGCAMTVLYAILGILPEDRESAGAAIIMRDRLGVSSGQLGEMMRTVVALNDRAGLSFNEIAEMIERDY